MKTHIIKLETYDDYISTRDKMGWNQGSRIILVWPEKGHPLNRRLDIILIQRHSHSIGAQLVFVTRDPEVSSFARERGIPLYRSLTRAQRARTDGHLEPRPGSFLMEAGRKHNDQILAALREQAVEGKKSIEINFWVRAVVFLIGISGIFALVALFFPRAVVVVQPVRRVQSLTIPVQANPTIEEVNYAGLVPASVLTTTVAGQADTLTSGSTTIAYQKAAGRVSFRNLTMQTVTVPAGSVVRGVDPTSPRFQTTQAVQVPTGVDQTASTPVVALEAGPGGNLPANRLMVIEGTLAQSLAVTNPLPTHGGNTSTVAAASQKDRQELFDRLQTQLRQTALADFQRMVAPADLIFTATLTTTRVIDQSFSPPGDSPSPDLQLNLQLEFQILVVTVDNLHRLANAILDANMPAGYIPIPGEEIKLSQHELETLDSQGVQWKMTLSREIQGEVNPRQVAQALAGLSPGNAKGLLAKELTLNTPPEITIQPAWWPRLPWLPFLISIEQAF